MKVPPPPSAAGLLRCWTEHRQDAAPPDGGPTFPFPWLEFSVSKHRRKTLQEQLDDLARLVVPVPVDVLRWQNAEAIRRVAAAGMVTLAAGSLEKQETPEVGASKASVPTASPLLKDHSGCSRKSA